LLRLSDYSNVPSQTSTMKKYICILAAAALLAACEQKTETTEPAASPAATATQKSPAAAAESPATTTESPAGAAESPAESPPSS